jgi:O-succinylbenzoic acid--CoA ligase
MPASFLRAAAAAGVRVHTSYGMTEMATQIATTRPGDGMELWLSSGRPLAPNTLRIAPDGEIEVGGETLFLGYWEQGGLRRPLTPDGWFRTGDLGALDAAGYLRVTGRRDNMFVSGGENVQPEEIEAALLRVPGIVRAVVVPAPHAEFGQTPVAFVAWDHAPPGADALRAALAGELPRFKVPKQFYAWPHADCGPDDKPRRADFAARAARGDVAVL